MSEKICGIYKITNLINGKVYIGQSQDIEHRWQEHRYNMYRKKYQNIILYKALKKYGIDNFSFTILEECAPEELDVKEIQYIKSFKSYVGFDDCNGYNMTLGGDGNRGAERTTEWNLRISEGHKGQIPWNRGEKYALPHIQGKYSGEKNPFYGRHHAEETKELLRKLAKNRVNGITHKVICDDVVYDSVASCAKHFNIDYRTMSDWLHGRRGMPEHFFNMGLRFADRDIVGRISCKATGKNNASSRSVQCINTGEIFDTMTDACKKYAVNINSMVAVCKGRRKSAGKLPTGEKLVWQYYQEE